MANEVEIVVKSTDRTGPGFAAARTGADRLKSRLKDVATTAAGFLSANVIQSGAQALTTFLTDSTGAARDLAESLNKSNTVFGTSAGAIEDWSKTADTGLGLSQQAALDAAGSFGNLFSQLGESDSSAADMSQSMVNLAADFASFHNADITEVLEAQQAAFRGEYDAVQRFVPLINAASVEQKALAQTGKDSADQLTAQEKAAATYALMIEGAGDATGDFERTSEGAANQQRIANAEMENAQAAIGEKLMPVMVAITNAKLKLAEILVDKVIPAFEAMGKWIGENKELIAAIAIGIMAALVPAFVAWAVAAGAAAIATIAAAAPFILLGAVIAAFAYLVITHWDTIRNATVTAFNAVKDAIAAAFNWVKRNWPLLLAILTGPIGLAVLAIATHWQTIKNGLSSLKNWIGRTASSMWQGLKSGLRAVVNWIIDRLNEIINAIDVAAGPTINFPSIPNIGGGGGGTNPRTTSRPGGIGGRAHGGVHGGGLVMVGERGRELLNLPAGSRVNPNANTEAMMRGGGGGVVVLRIDSGGSRLDDLLVQLLRRSIRDAHGGDVQAALGWQRG